MRIGNFDEVRRVFRQHGRLIHAGMELTSRCNQRCVHCLRSLSDTDGLAYPEVCNVVDQLAALGCLHVSFTGGEPLVRQDFMEIVSYASSRRCAVSVLTNGTLISAEIATRLRQLLVTEVQVSLYAADPLIHDAITTVPGSFLRTWQGIALLRAQGLRVRVAMPILNVNAGQVHSVARLCAEVGVAFFPVPLIFPKNNGDRSPLALLASNSQLEESGLRETVSAPGADTACPPDSSGSEIHARPAAPTAAPHSPALPAGASAARSGPPQYRLATDALCAAGRERLSIGVSGDIFPCDAWRIPLGNVRRDMLSDIWRDSPILLGLRGTRRDHPTNCDGCGARGLCMWCPGLSRDLVGDPLRPNPQDCRRTRTLYGAVSPDAAGWSIPPDLQEAGTDGVAKSP